MKTKKLSSRAVVIIEELLDARTYGRRSSVHGNYFFPLSREARIRELKRDYDIVFPIGLPEPYISRYAEFISRKQFNERQEISRVLPMSVQRPGLIGSSRRV